jgi:hypothetical protein
MDSSLLFIIRQSIVRDCYAIYPVLDSVGKVNGQSKVLHFYSKEVLLRFCGIWTDGQDVSILELGRDSLNK